MKKIKILSILAILLLAVSALFACSEKDPCKDGHTYGEPQVVRQADCYNQGAIKYVCTVCGQSEEKSVERTSHNYVDNCCTICGANALAHMNFQLNDDKQSYKLTKYTDSKVTEITIPATYNQKPVTVIGKEALGYLRELEKVTIPSSVVTLETSAFEGCSKLKTVVLSAGLKNIGDEAFQYCEALTDITLPSTVETIGYDAFMNCKSIEKLELPQGIKTLGTRALGDCASLTEMTIPAGVTEIPNELCLGCESVKSVTMLGEITQIGERAFSGCGSLERVSAAGTPEIDKGAFSGCRRLYSVDIDGGIGNVGEDAFSGCVSLHSITLSESLTQIGNNAFNGCRRLALIRDYSSISFEGNPGKIVEYARARTKKTTDSQYKIEYINDFAILVREYNVINTDQTVEKHREYYLIDYIGTNKTPTFPTFRSTDEYTVDSYIICKYAFDGYYDGEDIFFADLPDGVTTIEEYAFYCCERLLRIVVPKSVKEASPYIYNYSSSDSLAEVINFSSEYKPEKNYDTYDPPFSYVTKGSNLPLESVSQIKNINGYLILERNWDWHLLGYIGNERILRLPELPADFNYNYYINYNAFKDYNADGVVIPEGVIEIRDEAFAGKFILTDLVLPSTLKKIGNEAFVGATFGDLVVPDNVEEIGNNAFDLTTYNSITLPEGADIGCIMSHNCYDEDGMCQIGNVLVATSQTTVSGDVIIRDGVVQLANDLFRGNKNITSVVVPDGVKYIGSRVFLDCESLKTVTIPASVISVGRALILGDYDYAFEKIIYGGTKEQWLALTDGVRICSRDYTVECSDGILTVPYVPDVVA